jgi:hypothetical protein
VPQQAIFGKKFHCFSELLDVFLQAAQPPTSTPLRVSLAARVSRSKHCEDQLACPVAHAHFQVHLSVLIPYSLARPLELIFSEQTAIQKFVAVAGPIAATAGPIATVTALLLA